LYVVPVAAFFGLVAAVIIPKLNEQRSGAEETLPSMLVGHDAPNIRVTSFGDGPAPTDADLRKPGMKLLNFWASWCQPCRVEHPMLEKLKAEGVTIYGINYKDKPEDALKFLGEMGSPYAQIGADAGPMALDWGVYGVPETYVIDGKGVVVLRLAGPITEGNLESLLRPAMAKAAAE
jgi:cytochrome c biogenesis protein CcmG/thiol:disulfide interchange protein DsbE